MTLTLAIPEKVEARVDASGQIAGNSEGAHTITSH
jgi:hypothetical protein